MAAPAKWSMNLNVISGCDLRQVNVPLRGNRERPAIYIRAAIYAVKAGRPQDGVCELWLIIERDLIAICPVVLVG